MSVTYRWLNYKDQVETWDPTLNNTKRVQKMKPAPTETPPSLTNAHMRRAGWLCLYTSLIMLVIGGFGFFEPDPTVTVAVLLQSGVFFGLTTARNVLEDKYSKQYNPHVEADIAITSEDI